MERMTVLEWIGLIIVIIVLLSYFKGEGFDFFGLAKTDTKTTILNPQSTEN
jgi:hypothetical protein